MSADALRIAVTIATRGRPDGCRRLVRAVLDQQLPPDWELRVIVVDNDPAGSGLQLPDDARLEVRHEPEPGIPFARNRGVERALPWADVIVFVDDDEVPATESWLWTLVEGLDRYQADVVSGPVRSVFPAGTPSWVASHPVYKRHRYDSGERLSETHTANTAVRTDVFRDGRRFDQTARYTGGSDTLLFRKAQHAGACIRWVAHAAVEEMVPAERARIRWIVTRSFRIGANRIQFLRAGPASAACWLFTLTGSVVELMLGLVAPAVAMVSRRYALLILGRGARGAGTCAALLGVRYAAYP